MTHESLITIFAWMSVINLALFIIGMLKITYLKALTERITKAMFGNRIDDLLVFAPRALLNYYILILMFNVVPYFVLRFAV